MPIPKEEEVETPKTLWPLAIMKEPWHILQAPYPGCRHCSLIRSWYYPEEPSGPMPSYLHTLEVYPVFIFLVYIRSFLCMWASLISVCVQISSSDETSSQIGLGPTKCLHPNPITSLKTLPPNTRQIVRHWEPERQHMYLERDTVQLITRAQKLFGIWNIQY